jgi:hypothetical protein
LQHSGWHHDRSWASRGCWCYVPPLNRLSRLRNPRVRQDLATDFGLVDGFQPYSNTFVAPKCAAIGFNGYYVGTAAATTAYNGFGDPYIGTCFQFTVSGNRLTGAARDSSGDQYYLEGTVDAAGDTKFGVASGQQNVASFDGTIVGSTVSGTWGDITGCRGTWSGSRQ